MKKILLALAAFSLLPLVAQAQAERSPGSQPLQVQSFSLADKESVELSPAARSAMEKALAPCSTSGPTLCLQSGRFSLGVSWQTSDGATGNGQAVQLTPDSGYFWFFASNNIELVVKVLNACSFNNRYWVFGAGLTNVAFSLAVLDRSHEIINIYTNPQGRPTPPLQDTNAFATCP